MLGQASTRGLRKRARHLRLIPCHALGTAEWHEWMARIRGVICPPDRIGAHLDAALALQVGEDLTDHHPNQDRPSGPAFGRLA